MNESDAEALLKLLVLLGLTGFFIGFPYLVMGVITLYDRYLDWKERQQS